MEQGCKPGDHFCSSMVKVLVNYATENGTKVVSERSLIVKTDAFQGKVQAELFGDISIFGPEIRIYSETLPAMEKIQKAAGIERIFWPKFVFLNHYRLVPKQPLSLCRLIHCNNSTAMIVMEDLRPDYSMVHYGIPFDDLSLVVDNLAQFHALSLVVHEQDPSLTDYKNNVFTEENSDFIRTLMRGLQTLTKQTAQWTGFDKIHKKLSSLPEKLVTRVCEIYQGKCCSFNVLNHGDFHIRNLMFKRTNGCDVDDVKFLDFQICNWGSPAIDLSLLVHVNGDKHVADRREEIYLRYYESFRDYLRRFGYSKAKIPSLLDLKLEILRCGAVGKIYNGFIGTS